MKPLDIPPASCSRSAGATSALLMSGSVWTVKSRLNLQPSPQVIPLWTESSEERQKKENRLLKFTLDIFFNLIFTFDPCEFVGVRSSHPLEGSLFENHSAEEEISHVLDFMLKFYAHFLSWVYHLSDLWNWIWLWQVIS